MIQRSPAWREGYTRAYRLHPLGLILRGSTTYLAASRDEAPGVSLYALHRLRSVEMRPERTSFPPWFDLNAALERVEGNSAQLLRVRPEST